MRTYSHLLASKRYASRAHLSHQSFGWYQRDDRWRRLPAFEAKKKASAAPPTHQWCTTDPTMRSCVLLSNNVEQAQARLRQARRAQTHLKEVGKMKAECDPHDA